MKVTLRKADALQKSVQSAINAISLPAMVGLTRFGDPVKALDKCKKDFEKNLQKKLDLLSALYEIRNTVGTENASNRVTSILSKIAYLDKVNGTLSQFAGNGTNPRPNDTIIHQQADDLRQDTATPQYGSRRETFTVGILSETEIEAYKRQIEENRKMRQDLSDELLSINVKTEIEIPTGMREILEKYNII